LCKRSYIIGGHFVFRRFPYKNKTNSYHIFFLPLFSILSNQKLQPLKMDFLDENIQQGIKKGLRSMTHILYNELYVYVWFICIYHVILVILLLTNLILLIKIYSHRTPQFPLSLFSTATFPSITQEIPLSKMELLKESFVKLAQQQV